MTRHDTDLQFRKVAAISGKHINFLAEIADRKAAWTVDEWPANVVELYAQSCEAGLRELPGVGKSIASEIAKLLTAFAAEKATEKR